MSIPGTEFNIRNPGLGTIPANAAKVQAKLGVCQKGATSAILSASSPQAAKDAIGSGPMLDALGQVLKVAGGPVLAVPVLPSTYGTVTSSLALTGVGTGTVAGSLGPEQVVKVKIILGGARGTATFQVAVGSGAYGSTVVTAATYQVPGQMFTTLAFNTGTYVQDDVYTLNLDGTVSRAGTGTATLLNASTHSPVDAYNVWVEITTSGALATSAFRYSLDGGALYSGAILTPSGGLYAVPGTGVVLTFAGTFTKGDVYKGTSTASTFSTGDVTTAFNALLADSSFWGFAHVVGTPASAAAAASLAAAVGTAMDAAELGKRFVHAIIDCPVTEGMAAVKAAFASFVHARVTVCAGDVMLLSPLTTRTQQRALGWAYSARESWINPSTSPAQVETLDGTDRGGALRNVRAISGFTGGWDEAATPGLDDARFVTARTLGSGPDAVPGFFITDGHMMDAPGGDFVSSMNRRVIDLVCMNLEAAMIRFLHKKLRVTKSGARRGFIDERDARGMEAIVNAKLEAAVISSPQEASGVLFSVSRTDPLLSSPTFNTETEVVPFGYAKHIVINVGYKNPLLG